LQSNKLFSDSFAPDSEPIRQLRGSLKFILPYFPVLADLQLGPWVYKHDGPKVSIAALRSYSDSELIDPDGDDVNIESRCEDSYPRRW
jgi:hypothetical protein